PDLATVLSNQSNRLGELGRHEEALTAATRVARVYEKLAAEHPDAFLPDLAMALSNQSGRLAELERYEEALTAATRAAQMYE
ncbi:hypothetical protein ACFW9N_44765, partial [Streptomyces sp. NPDC059496]|uniref:hypothetical protein n=1 Tax=Streptomyces sp. NPDC059496 TaxID=3346851 RepID=UPI003690E138